MSSILLPQNGQAVSDNIRHCFSIPDKKPEGWRMYKGNFRYAKPENAMIPRVCGASFSIEDDWAKQVAAIHKE